MRKTSWTGGRFTIGGGDDAEPPVDTASISGDGDNDDATDDDGQNDATNDGNKDNHPWIVPLEAVASPDITPIVLDCEVRHGRRPDGTPNPDPHIYHYV